MDKFGMKEGMKDGKAYGKEEFKDLMIAFISHQLFTKGDFKKNKRDLEKLAKEVWAMGIIPIMPHTLTPGTIVKGKEINRNRGLAACREVIKRCDMVIFDCNKISEGVEHEIRFAKEQNIFVVEIHYLRNVLSTK